MLILHAQIYWLVTLKPAAEDLHNPAEIRAQAKPNGHINNYQSLTAGLYSGHQTVYLTICESLTLCNSVNLSRSIQY